MPDQEARFEARSLVADHPPLFRSEKKRALFERVAPAGTEHGGTLEVLRFGPRSVTGVYDPKTPSRLEVVAGVFGYTATGRGTDWYLNFAHHELFSCYGTRLFAQDELQVAEHPALASLCEALLADPIVTPLTVEDGEPTPVLIRGVERHAAIDTREIYGNALANAPDHVVDRAVHRIEPPTTSNILAIEAPFGPSGPYTEAHLDYILRTAFSGFAAAVESSPVAAVIHTGFWGCGAYGGNRVLMPLLQLVAAQLAGVRDFVFYAVTDDGVPAFEEARRVLAELAPEAVDVGILVQRILRYGFRWGVSNGT